MSIRVNGLATLTRDTEICKVTGGAWCNFGVATTRRNAKEGAQDVDFFEASYFLKNLDSPIANSLKKGTTLYLDNAELRANQYERDGAPRSVFKILIYSFDIISEQNTEKESVAEGPAIEKPKPIEPPIEVPPTVQPTVEEDEEDIIPF